MSLETKLKSFVIPQEWHAQIRIYLSLISVSTYQININNTFISERDILEEHPTADIDMLKMIASHIPEDKDKFIYEFLMRLMVFKYMC